MRRTDVLESPVYGMGLNDSMEIRPGSLPVTPPRVRIRDARQGPGGSPGVFAPTSPLTPPSPPPELRPPPSSFVYHGGGGSPLVSRLENFERQAHPVVASHRATELALLRRHIAAVERGAYPGTPPPVHVVGVRGSGKRALLQLALHAESSWCAFLRARECFSYERLIRLLLSSSDAPKPASNPSEGLAEAWAALSAHMAAEDRPLPRKKAPASEAWTAEFAHRVDSSAGIRPAFFLVIEEPEALSTAMAADRAAGVLAALARFREVEPAMRTHVALITVGTVAWARLGVSRTAWPPIELHMAASRGSELVDVVLEGREQVRPFFVGYEDAAFDAISREYVQHCVPLLELYTRDVAELQHALWVRLLPAFLSSLASSSGGSGVSWLAVKADLHTPLQECIRCLYQREQSRGAAPEPRRLLELPFYSKFLVIAAFLAGHNAPASDEQIFGLVHGRAAARTAILPAQAVADGVTLGAARAFSFGRLLYIFRALTSDRDFDPSVQLAHEVQMLCRLHLLSPAPSGFYCNASYGFVQDMARVVYCKFENFLQQ